jgi:hypothetical protein
LREPEYTYPVRVILYDNDDIPGWDEVCMQAIELFGLPGNRYITDISANSMDWIFRSSQDALLFKLKFSKVVV